MASPKTTTVLTVVVMLMAANTAKLAGIPQKLPWITDRSHSAKRRQGVAAMMAATFMSVVILLTSAIPKENT